MPDAIIAGNIHFESIINKNEEIVLKLAGGSALYATAGFILWGKKPGLLAKIREDHSTNWMADFRDAGCDTTGITKTIESIDQDRFYAIDEASTINTDNPQKYFFKFKQPLPKFLLGYEVPQISNEINRASHPSSIKPEEIPEDYLKVNHLVMTPMDLNSHMMVPPYYRSQTEGDVICCGSASFMQPSFWYEFPPLIRGSDVFITNEMQLKRLFLGKTDAIWEMIEFVADTGIEIIAVFNENKSHYLFDQPSNKKYEIPAYTTEMIDPIGAYATFCGGFAAGYITHYDPRESALMASVAASIKNEGTGPLYVMQTLPELAQARLEMLRDEAIEV